MNLTFGRNDVCPHALSNRPCTRGPGDDDEDDDDHQGENDDDEPLVCFVETASLATSLPVRRMDELLRLSLGQSVIDAQFARDERDEVFDYSAVTWPTSDVRYKTAPQNDFKAVVLFLVAENSEEYDVEYVDAGVLVCERSKCRALVLNSAAAEAFLDDEGPVDIVVFGPSVYESLHNMARGTQTSLSSFIEKIDEEMIILPSKGAFNPDVDSANVFTIPSTDLSESLFRNDLTLHFVNSIVVSVEQLVRGSAQDSLSILANDEVNSITTKTADRVYEVRMSTNSFIEQQVLCPLICPRVYRSVCASARVKRRPTNTPRIYSSAVSTFLWAIFQS